MRNSNLLTEFNDISQRLEYLVAHSSQMVFVTGEEVAIQQGFVEAFLGQQSSTSNVAFLAARRGKPSQFYRQQFGQQFDIPLNKHKQPLVQAFAVRPEKDLPVVIAITGAENLPEEILRELWDLVLQNRFARNVEQINILLFGDQEWAEEVKSWLPTNNNDKPVLLTTQTLEYDEEHEIEGDLEALIANRRKQFQDRLKARSDEYNQHVPPFKQWWFKLLVASVFLVSFGSILLWQYFDVSKATFTEFTQFLFQSDSISDSQKETNETVLAAMAKNDSDAESKDAAEISEESDIAPEQNNQRVAANFQDALSNLDSERASIEPAQDDVISVRIQPVQGQNAELYESEFIVDITPEQLKQLKLMTDSGEDGAITVTSGSADFANSTIVATEQDIASTEQRLQRELRPSQRQEQDVSDAVAIALQEMAAMEQELQQVQAPAQLELVDGQNTDPAMQNLIDSALAYADTLTEPLNTAADNARSVVLSQVAQVNTLESAQPTVNDASTIQTSIENTVEPAVDLVQDDVNEFVPSEEGSVVTQSPISTNQSVSQSVSSAQVVGSVNDSFTLTNEGQVQDYAIEDTSPLSAPETIATEAVYNFDEALLLQEPDNHFVLQITGISSLSLLNEYLIDNNLQQTVWVYQTQRYGGDWFVVLLNQSYSNIDEARSATSLIQQVVPNAQPFAKSINQIKGEIQP
ncbi:MAG: hypothetical protein GJ680_13685 [Alteromonadaceae bacterium]|nr:hypothetical protein [Alteromonadaceae bacterium]